MNGKKSKKYSSPKLRAYGNLRDQTRGPGGATADGASGGSRK